MEQNIQTLINSLILGNCALMTNKNYDGGINLRMFEFKDLISALEQSMIIKRNDLSNIIREELTYRMKPIKEYE
jgi:hypothetical protein